MVSFPFYKKQTYANLTMKIPNMLTDKLKTCKCLSFKYEFVSEINRHFNKHSTTALNPLRSTSFFTI